MSDSKPHVMVAIRAEVLPGETKKICSNIASDIVCLAYDFRIATSCLPSFVVHQIGVEGHDRPDSYAQEGLPADFWSVEGQNVGPPLSLPPASQKAQLFVTVTNCGLERATFTGAMYCREG